MLHYRRDLSEVMLGQVVPEFSRLLHAAGDELAAKRYAKPDIFDREAARQQVLHAFIEFVSQAQVDDPYMLHVLQVDVDHAQAWFQEVQQ